MSEELTITERLEMGKKLAHYVLDGGSEEEDYEEQCEMNDVEVMTDHAYYIAVMILTGEAPTLGPGGRIDHK